MRKMNRRDFLKTTAFAAVGSTLIPQILHAEEATKPSLLVVHGKDPVKMLQAGIEQLGGWSALVKKGQRVTLKPNAAWATTAAEGGNTDPQLVGEFVKACLQAGARQVNLPENTCSSEKKSFSMSGIAEAVKAAGGRLYRPVKGKDYKTVELPRAKVLTKADVPKDVLDCDVLVNMPVAKSHGGSILTISMKNWMGSVEDRGFWHRHDLHQCIADFSTFIKPHLIIVDATRIMVTNGPRGPGDLEYPQQIIFGKDPVAVDAYASTLFKKKPFDIPYIRIAHEMGVGCGHLDAVDIRHMDA
jgi:uncharacterized protein (DUF362 family)